MAEFLNGEEILFIRMDDGESFYDVLYEILRDNGITSGIVLNGIGMLRNFEIGWFSGERYETERIEGKAYELISMNGNISVKDDEIFAHIHVGLASPERKMVGGHLFDATVNNTVELFVLKLKDVKLKRVERGGYTPLMAITE